jgi:hypothetical protein
MTPASAARNVRCEDCGHSRENHDYRGCLVWINADASKPCSCAVVRIEFVHIRR